MRIRSLAGATALALVVLGATAAPSEAVRRGKIVVPKSITLNFPKPGTYVGLVKVRKPVVKVVPRVFKDRPSKAERKKAVRTARRECAKSAAIVDVSVIHLSKPPFTIGTVKATPISRSGTAQYAVTGNEPPTGDKVQALQRASKRFAPTKNYSWAVVCRRATVIRPYPY